MGGPDSQGSKIEGGHAELRDAIRRAFVEFLTIPTWIVAAFLILAVGTYALDHTDIAWLGAIRQAMRENVFSDPQATSDLLSTLAGGLITVTSITISLVLLAVQQAAGSLTSQVIDQFLRRRLNQATFGFFVGLALYTLVTLSTVGTPFNPVHGATVALVLTVVAFYLLLLLLYTTINQMRPIEIVTAIHDHLVVARERQLPLISKTRRSSCYAGSVTAPVPTQHYGYVANVDVDAIGAAIAEAQAEVEVTLLVSIGSYVAFQDTIAEIKARTTEHLAAIGEAVERAVHLERQRELEGDPAYGIEQILTIAWTSVSTSKSNPGPGLEAIRSLRDVLARRSAAEARPKDGDEQIMPVVYTDDVLPRLMDAFETLAVTSSESMQHMVFAEVAHTFAITFERLPPRQQARAEDLILRILSALGDHVLTGDLDAALSALTRTLEMAGRPRPPPSERRRPSSRRPSASSTPARRESRPEANPAGRTRHAASGGSGAAPPRGAG